MKTETTLKEVAMDELLKESDLATRERVLDAIRRLGATHVVMAENQDFSSSSFGLRTFMAVGPNCTYKAPEDCEGGHLNDLPSQRQYFTAFAKVV